jgi:hypothetical protein
MFYLIVEGKFNECCVKVARMGQLSSGNTIFFLRKEMSR